jgi:hypothetical protein
MGEIDIENLIPLFKTVAGQRFFTSNLKKNTVRKKFCNCTMDYYYSYAELLKDNGFNEKSKREVSAGSDYSYDKNVFYIFNKKDINVYLTWNASEKSVCITAEIGVVLPPEKFSFSTQRGNEIFITQLPVNGMCYAIKLLDGSFIMVDGGTADDKCEQKIYEFLVENSKGKPIVATWFFTHAHIDHIGLATEFIEKYKDKLEVKSFAYQFPDFDMISMSMESEEQTASEVLALETAISNSFPLAQIYSTHTGQEFCYEGLNVEVLYSIDDTCLDNYATVNEQSLALLLKTKNTTACLLGDCMLSACRRIAHTYRDYLKSDILQLAHHGLIGGDRWLYELIDPDICFWPTGESRFLGKTSGRYEWCLGEGNCDYNGYIRDEKIKKRTHLCHDKIHQIKM